VGELWENFVIAERLKQNIYAGSFAQSYFWRTRQQHEIDYVEEVDGQLHAFEFKWNERKSHCKCPDSFSTAYPDATFQVITPKNIEEFLMA
jgi:predicted AAA+ superfamily ATPase